MLHCNNSDIVTQKFQLNVVPFSYLFSGDKVKYVGSSAVVEADQR
jgi:hypothetical protein